MRIANRFFLIVMIVVCMGGVARAGSWRVEQDGTGDFTVIQSAVDAAAGGDTILIGPGHYQETHAYDPQGGSVIQVAVSWNDSRELSFIGAGKDVVLVGPDSYSGMGPSGFWHESDASLLVEGISFQNCSKSIITQGGCEIRSCRFSDTRAGIHVYGTGSGVCLISNCEFFRQQQGGGGIAVWSASQVTVENCYFEDENFYIQGVQDARISGCDFLGRVGSLIGTNGEFLNNQSVISSNKALYLDAGSQVLVRDCMFSVSDTGSHNISVFSSGTFVELVGNIFNGGSYSTIDIAASPTIVGSGNHFLKGSSDYIVVIQFWEHADVGSVDLRNNYWGTDNPYLVGQWILDGADDPNIAVEVQYEPIADGPLPAESTTLDGLKAMYRNGAK